jgi:hypothetical protein
MRQMHINDFAHCWWKSKWLNDLIVFRDPRWPTTPYYSVSAWFT